ncbi:MAG: phosphatidylserine decarboxylase [Opitutaceae bacterium]|nr:phosphatidylserine decarboxylase [Opitutaceae bacterium]
MSGQPIEVINRYTGAVEVEQVYGDRWLRWTYETGAGRLALALAVRRSVFSRFFGWRMSRPASRAKIAPFVRDYGLDPAEFAEPLESYASFNEFFSRRLRPGARPVCGASGDVAFPADGRHLGIDDLAAADHFYAKGQRFDLAALVGEAGLARRFAGGTMVISRLCPVDYHRFHFPVGGRAGAPVFLEGELYSVSPIALRRRLDYLVENKRARTLVETPDLGGVLIVEIGATCVGTIAHTAGAGEVARGDEKGYFRFGGSCVITIFERGRIDLAPDLRAAAASGRELYARVGDRMATAARVR